MYILKRHFQENAVIPETPSLKTLSTSPPLLGPHDVCKSSGKFSKPTKISGKNYCKDEVVIRNSDSGKGKNIFLHFLFIGTKRVELQSLTEQNYIKHVK